MVNGCGLHLQNRCFPKFTSFSGQETWFYCRLKLGTWFPEYHKALLLFCCSGNVCGGGPTTSFYRGLVVSKCDDTLGETLGLNDNQLASLFQ